MLGAAFPVGAGHRDDAGRGPAEPHALNNRTHRVEAHRNGLRVLLLDADEPVGKRKRHSDTAGVGSPLSSFYRA